MSNKKNKSKITITMSDVAEARLKRLMERTGRDVTEVIRVALHLLDLAHHTISSGGSVQIVDSGKTYPVTLWEDKSKEVKEPDTAMVPGREPRREEFVIGNAEAGLFLGYASEAAPVFVEIDDARTFAEVGPARLAARNPVLRDVAERQRLALRLYRRTPSWKLVSL